MRDAGVAEEVSSVADCLFVKQVSGVSANRFGATGVQIPVCGTRKGHKFLGVAHSTSLLDSFFQVGMVFWSLNRQQVSSFVEFNLYKGQLSFNLRHF